MDITPWVISDEECRFINGAEIVGVVYGNLTGLVVVPLDCSIEDMTAFVELIHARRYQYCGLMTYRDGASDAKCQPNAEAVFIMANACWKFGALVKERLDAKKQASADWCKKLFEMPDTR